VEIDGMNHYVNRIEYFHIHTSGETGWLSVVALVDLIEPTFSAFSSVVEMESEIDDRRN
jgi:hypothetical protein